MGNSSPKARTQMVMVEGPVKGTPGRKVIREYMVSFLAYSPNSPDELYKIHGAEFVTRGWRVKRYLPKALHLAKGDQTILVSAGSKGSTISVGEHFNKPSMHRLFYEAKYAFAGRGAFDNTVEGRIPPGSAAAFLP